MPWTWFASVDFQMFLLVPLLGLLFQRTKLGGYIATLTIVVLSVFLTALLNGLASKTGANPYLDSSFFTDIYIKPWARASPYFIGVFFGSTFFYYSKNSDQNYIFSKIKYNPIIRAAIYWIGFVLWFTTIAVLFSYTKDYGNNWPSSVKIIYAAISPITFICGVTSLILPALLGKAKLVRFLLKGPILNLLGKVTFMVALSHPILLIGIYTTVGQQIYIESYKMFTLFVGHSFLSYIIGSAVGVLFELPARGLESIWHDRYYAHLMVHKFMNEKELSKGDQSRTSNAQG